MHGVYDFTVVGRCKRLAAELERDFFFDSLDKAFFYGGVAVNIVGSDAGLAAV